MKQLVIISLFLASAALAGQDSTSVQWTSDSTYVKGGVEYYTPEASFNKTVQKYVIDDLDGQPKANEYEIYMGKEYDSNPRNPNADLWLFKPAMDIV
jgi:hypothetical protein